MCWLWQDILKMNFSVGVSMYNEKVTYVIDQYCP